MVGRETLTNAVALNSASFNLGRMIGPAVAGGIIALLGSGVGASGWVILLNSATYLAVLVALKRMRSEELHPVPTLPRAKGQLREGIAYVRSRPDIMLVMAVLACAGTFGFNFQMTMALMATEVYGKGAGEYGLLGSILAIGSLSGALIAARRTASSQRLVVVSAVVFGLVTLAAGLMPTYLTFALVLPVAGITSMTLMTAANSFVQMATDPAMRGRVLALYFAVFMGGTPIGAPLLGWVAEHAGARWTLIGGGGITALGAVADRRLHRPPSRGCPQGLRLARPPTASPTTPPSPSTEFRPRSTLAALARSSRASSTQAACGRSKHLLVDRMLGSTRVEAGIAERRLRASSHMTTRATASERTRGETQNRASTNSSGSKGTRSPSDSPRPTSLTGMPSSVSMAKTMPPLAEPSSLVSTTPVSWVASPNSRAWASPF